MSQSKGGKEFLLRQYRKSLAEAIAVLNLEKEALDAGTSEGIEISGLLVTDLWGAIAPLLKYNQRLLVSIEQDDTETLD